MKLRLFSRTHKIWKKEEVSFLKLNYPVYGIKYCCGILNRSKLSVQRKIEALQLKKISVNIKYTKENVFNAVSESKNYTDVARKFGLNGNYGNRQTIKKYIEKYNIDISHFDFGASASASKKFVKKYSLEEILVKNSPFRNNSELKKRLFNAKLKINICEECGQGEIWREKRMSLILDHIDGINDNNEIENLRILCPNCNSTLETHCKGNLERYNKNILIKKELNKNKKICTCGNKKDRGSKKCNKCYANAPRRKFDIPDYEILLKQIEESNYCAVGRAYGVSWIKYYKKQNGVQE